MKKKVAQTLHLLCEYDQGNTCRTLTRVTNDLVCGVYQLKSAGPVFASNIIIAHKTKKNYLISMKCDS